MRGPRRGVPQRRLQLVLIVALALVVSCKGGPDMPAVWMQDALWDDGNAEFACYAVTWSRYGTSYAGRALLVLVKEPWSPELNVKADTPRPDGFDVLKVNHLRDVPTGIYTYHQAASVFLRRQDAQLVKFITSSTEACGISTSRWHQGVLETHSYFDGQGDHSMTWPEHTWPWEALPALLRGFVDGEAPKSLRVFPSLLQSRFPELREREWKITRHTGESVKVPAGTFGVVEFTLRHGDDVQRFAFDATFPHTLVRYRGEDGTEYRLAKRERLPYWQMHEPGGESWYPPSLRDGYGR